MIKSDAWQPTGIKNKILSLLPPLIHLLLECVECALTFTSIQPNKLFLMRRTVFDGILIGYTVHYILIFDKFRIMPTCYQRFHCCIIHLIHAIEWKILILHSCEKLHDVAFSGFHCHALFRFAFVFALFNFEYFSNMARVSDTVFYCCLVITITLESATTNSDLLYQHIGIEMLHWFGFAIDFSTSICLR